MRIANSVLLDITISGRHYIMSLNYIIDSLLQTLNRSELSKRIARGAFWSFSGTAMAKFLILLSGILLAHILERKEYGEFGMIRSTINMFVVFGVAGLGVTATKYISEYRDNYIERIPSIYILTNGFSHITGLLVVSMVLVFSTQIAISLDSPHLSDEIKIGAILLYFTILIGTQNGVLAGFEDFKSIAVNGFWGAVAESVFLLLGAFFYGVIGAIFGFGTGFIVQYYLNKRTINKIFKKKGIHISSAGIRKEDFKLLYKFSLPAALSSFMTAPAFWITRAFLIKQSGFEELAIYEAADQWKVIILFIPTAVGQIVLPILSSISKTKDEFVKVLHVNLLMNIAVTFTLSIFVLFLGRSIMSLYGKDYMEGSVLTILTFSTIFTSVASVVGMSIYSRGKVWVGFTFNLIWSLLFILISYYLVSIGYGAEGLAIGLFVAYFIHSSCQYIYLRFSLK